MKKAKYQEVAENEKVKCLLCPHNCIISKNKTGICVVRKNVDGELVSLNYSKISGFHFDPIEKKPLYHFFPSKIILSVGSIGCNLKCNFCQNWEIASIREEIFEENIFLQNLSVEELAKQAIAKKENIGIAYTYNEPTVFYEYMLEAAKLTKRQNLKNVMISNGFINQKPLNELLDYIDAFNIDLKAFNENFYKKLTSSQLEPVKETLKQIRKSGKHLEITNLVITDENDNLKEFEEMLKWISGELGENTVLHLSRYFPRYKLNHDSTPSDILFDFLHKAHEYLPYTYLGNIISYEGQNTYCPQCGELLIARNGYSIEIKNLTKDSKCKSCEKEIPVVLK